LKNFVHLHVHTDHSFLDGCAKVPVLIGRVKELGMPAVAMTDHGNMCGAIDFYQAALKAGVKPIIGMEAYFVNDHSMLDHPKRDREKSDDIDGVESDTTMLQPQNFPKFQIHHKTLLAQNYEGFLNLAKLTSESYLKGFYRRPRIDTDLLAKYSKGIIALSGCLNGVASQYLLYSDYESARAVTAKFVDIFGRDNYYIEIQNHFLPPQKKIIPGLIKLAREFGLKLIATNDTHYVRKDDAAAHDAMLCIQTGSVISETKRMRYPNNEFYVKSREEMEIAFPELPEALDNTLELAEKVEIKIPMGENHYPRYQKPADLKFDRRKEKRGLGAERQERGFLAVARKARRAYGKRAAAFRFEQKGSETPLRRRLRQPFGIRPQRRRNARPRKISLRQARLRTLYNSGRGLC